MKTINHDLLKVLFGVGILAMFLLAYSCSQETVTDPALNGAENLNGINAKSSNAARATRAIRAKLNNAPAVPLETFTGNCFILDDPGTPEINEELIIELTTNDIFGNMTHLGKIQPGTQGIPVECNFNADGSLQTVYLVNYIGAHGDEIHSTDYVTIIPDCPTCTTGTFEGTLVINGGTGRFVDAKGDMVFVNATYDGPNSTWELVGTITY